MIKHQTFWAYYTESLEQLIDDLELDRERFFSDYEDRYEWITDSGRETNLFRDHQSESPVVFLQFDRGPRWVAERLGVVVEIGEVTMSDEMIFVASDTITA